MARHLGQAKVKGTRWACQYLKVEPSDGPSGSACNGTDAGAPAGQDEQSVSDCDVDDGAQESPHGLPACEGDGAEESPHEVPECDGDGAQESPDGLTDCDDDGAEESPHGLPECDGDGAKESPHEVPECDGDGAKESPHEVPSCDGDGAQESPHEVPSCDGDGAKNAPHEVPSVFTVVESPASDAPVLDPANQETQVQQVDEADAQPPSPEALLQACPIHDQHKPEEQKS